MLSGGRDPGDKADMSDIWEFLSWFKFIGKLADRSVGGVSLHYFYITALFAGFWLYLIYSAVKYFRAAPAKISLKPYAYLALTIAVFFFLSGDNNDLHLAFTYEVQNLMDASAAVSAKDLSLLAGQTRIVPLIFAAVLYFSNLQALNLVLCVFMGLFYAVWGRILGEVFGFKTRIAFPLTLLAVILQKITHYFFSAYAIFALFFSALFLYRLLALVKDAEKDHSFFRLSQPVYLILLASMFRQESVVLFLVYFAGIAFLKRAAFKKAAVCLLAGAVLYLPFLYRDWIHEENQTLKYHWDQEMVGQIYDSASWKSTAPEVYRQNYLLMNVADAIKRGPQYPGMSRQEFMDSVRTAYFMPQPSVLNIWYNLKYRSRLFMLLTAGWFAVFVISLARLRRLREELRYLSVLSAYIWSLFLIYHLAALAISIGLSYNYLLPAYIAFCLLVGRNIHAGKAGAL